MIRKTGNMYKLKELLTGMGFIDTLITLKPMYKVGGEGGASQKGHKLTLRKSENILCTCKLGGGGASQ